MPKNMQPSPSGLPRVQLNMRVDPEIKAWLEQQQINPALFLEAAALAEKKLRSAGKGFGKSKK